MSDEEKLKQPDDTQESSASPKKSGGMIKTILIAAGAFVIAIGGFSYMLGVFSSSPQEAETEVLSAEPDSLTHDVEQAQIDSINEEAEIAALENEIFGMDGAHGGSIDDYIGIMNEKESRLTVGDSIATMDWITAEKKRLAAWDAELAAKKNKLDAQETRLEQIIAQVNQIESARIGALAKLYEGMKAEQVAPLLSQLTDNQAVHVLMRMKSTNAAKVLESLNPEFAARISSNMITLNKE
jgi:flagellar motility protein MotE (MotC chaperone)